jgi:O-antigen/teichoic acid export membrane protein/2-polyprenyl-3-methyl-5-hydroxy-6-metoxy-1,4-benzoquinol methylase
MSSAHLTPVLAETTRVGARVAGLRLVGAAVAFASSALIARTLGPTGRGIYALPIAFLGIVMALSHVGLESANVFHAGRGVALRRLWGTDAVAAVLFSLVAWAAVALLALASFSGTIQQIPTGWIVVAVAQLPVVLMSMYWSSLLQLEGSFGSTAVRVVVAASLHAGAVAIFAMLGHLTPFTALALTWVTVGVTWVLVFRLGIRRRIANATMDRQLLVKGISIGLRTQMATMLVFLLLRVDQLLVQRTLGFHALGLYAIAVVVAELLWLVTDPLAGSVLRHLVAADQDDEHRLGFATARLELLAAAVVCAVLWVAAPYVIRIAYGDAYLDAVWPIRWLLPGVVAVAAQRPLYAIVTKRGRLWVAAALNAGALLTNVALNLLLLPRIGLVGASVASTLSYVAVGLGYLKVTHASTVAGLRDIMPRREDVSRLASGLRESIRIRSDGGDPSPIPEAVPQLAPSADSKPGMTVMRCPLCGGGDALLEEEIPYTAIWEGLADTWGAVFPSEVRERHQHARQAELVRCQDCDLQYFRAAVPGDAEFYRLLTKTMPYHTARWEFGVALSRISNGSAVADLGCGDGAFLRLAASRARRVVGVDHHLEAIHALSAAGLEGTTEGFEAFARREAGMFDVVCSFHTLEHLADVDAAVRSARTLLRPRGLLFLSVPNRDRLRFADGPLDCPPHHVSRWSSRQFTELASRFDLSLVSVLREPPDLSHARLATIQARRSRRVELAGAGGLALRVSMRTAMTRRRHVRAITDGEYEQRGWFGHSMVGIFQAPIAAPKTLRAASASAAARR